MSGPQPHFLVVDDDRLMMQVMRAVLRQEGFHNIEFAGNAQAAIDKCREKAPDIVFMDIEMPGMNGIEAMDAIAELGMSPQFVLISGSPTTKYVEAAKEHNVAGFVVKPVSGKVVGSAIAECLRRAPLLPRKEAPLPINPAEAASPPSDAAEAEAATDEATAADTGADAATTPEMGAPEVAAETGERDGQDTPPAP